MSTIKTNSYGELWQLDASELAACIARREASCTDAVRSHLDRLEAVNPQINAVVDAMAEEALAAAKVADMTQAKGGSTGPLHGVPVTIKVNVDCQGHATTNGILGNRNHVAQHDSAVVANLRRAGAIIIGRTNTPAYSIRWFTDNALHGRTLNPHDARLTPGGSSGGAAAAVSVGIGAIGHGNDQGGSIRYPAYACGVYGLRPGYGRVPAFNPSATTERPPVVQLTSTQGPLARSVADIRLALAAMSGCDLRDPHWTPQPTNAGQDLPKRVALCKSVPGYVADPTVVNALEQAARWLQDAGYEVEEAVPPQLQEAADLWDHLSMNDTREVNGEAILSCGDGAVEHAYLGMLHCAQTLDLAGYMRALASRTALQRAWAQFMAKYPLLLLPTSWETPFPIDLDQTGNTTMRRILDAQSPVLAGAILGLPGLAVPMGLVQGVPTGVQLMCARFNEELCLQAGEAIEQRQGRVRPINPA